MSYFTPSGSSGSTSTVVITGVTSPLITDISIAVANTEQTYVLPANTKRYTVQVLNTSHVKLAFIPGSSGTDYVPIAPNAFAEDDNISTSLLTLYIQSPGTGIVAKLITWT